ncbi:PIN domain-containing protein [Roseateles depolymerans]|uniref:Putative nucleic acid-binding protein n=1 Tax=Roseateles depolymerans TaxID=76731 RepID=A0A0U3CUP8_9BURK|nr:PIN domain-containing protein [Roseateles depolymerans]ALV05046.1 Putative nucleic acid-binding protein [Roseateles depolymerans]REG14940.1 PIN domain-containing protein [Roseateles depolymerans]
MNHAVSPPSLPDGSPEAASASAAHDPRSVAATTVTEPRPTLVPALPHRVILDTQIVMDWLVFDEPRVMPIIALVESRHLLWTATPAMQAEMLHVLGRGVAARYEPDLTRIQAAFAGHCELVEEPVLGMGRPRCSDEDDQKFIDLGLHLASLAPTTLISRDRAVLKVAKRAARLGLEIVSPDIWIKRNPIPTQPRT